MLACVLITRVSLCDNGEKTAPLGQVSCAILGVCLDIRQIIEVPTNLPY